MEGDGSSDTGSNEDTGHPNKKFRLALARRHHRASSSSEDDDGSAMKKDGASESTNDTSLSGDSSDDNNTPITMNSDENAAEPKSSGVDDDNRRKRKAMWIELFDKRPRNANNEEMSAWLMATIAVSDPEGHPLGDAVRKYIDGEKPRASQKNSQD